MISSPLDTALREVLKYFPRTNEPKPPLTSDDVAVLQVAALIAINDTLCDIWSTLNR